MSTSPIPWKRDEVAIIDANGQRVEDGAFYLIGDIDMTVRAVNSHAELVAALEAITNHSLPRLVDGLREQANAALAKAKGAK